jgi:hypothetical protein
VTGSVYLLPRLILPHNPRASQRTLVHRAPLAAIYCNASCYAGKYDNANGVIARTPNSAR